MKRNSNESFPNTSRHLFQPLLKRHHSSSKQNAHLLSLTPEALDRIIYYLLPVPQQQHEICFHLVKHVLPLSLTCRTLFHHVTNILNQLSHKLFPTDFYSCVRLNDYLPAPSTINLLLRVCLIKIKQLQHYQNIQHQNESEDTITSLVASIRRYLLRTDTNHPFISETISENKRCDATASLLDPCKHTLKCSYMIMWLVLTANAETISRLLSHEQVVNPASDDSLYCCVLRICHILQHSPVDINITTTQGLEAAHACTKENIVIVKETTRLSHQLESLNLDYSNINCVNRIRATHFPNLKHISFKTYKDFCRGRKHIIAVLKSLRNQNTHLKSISLDSANFFVHSKSVKPLNLLQLAPHVQTLSLTGETYRNYNWQPSFRYCANISTLTFNALSMDFEKLIHIVNLNLLPNLQNIFSHNVGFLVYDPSLEGTDEYKKTAKLVTSVQQCSTIIPDPFQQFITFSNIRKLHLRFLDEFEIPDLRKLIQCAQIEELSILNIERLELNRSKYHNFCSLLTDTLLENAFGMKVLVIDNLCVSFEDIITLLRRMGRNAIQFKLLFSLQRLMDDSQIKVRVENVMDILQKLVVRCPNIRDICIMSEETFQSFGKDKEHIVENEVARVNRLLKHFRPSSFFDFAEPV